MNKDEKQVIKRLLNLYPDVIKDLGGDAFVSNDEKIENIGSYIKNHKWFVNQELPFIVTMEEAFFSWHENVYIPQINAMNDTKISTILNQFNKFELFSIVSDEYYYLKENNDSAYYDKACYEVINRESKSFFTRKMAKSKLQKVS